MFPKVNYFRGYTRLHIFIAKTRRGREFMGILVFSPSRSINVARRDATSVQPPSCQARRNTRHEPFGCSNSGTPAALTRQNTR